MTQIGAMKHFTTTTVLTRAAGVTGVPEITITTNSVDRESDRMVIDRLVVPPKLPVLFSHQTRDLPVGMTTEIVRSPTSLRARFKWLENDARAAAVRNAFEQDFLSASVGVRVTESTPNVFGGSDFGGELLEWSLVGIPANPECVRLLRSLGFDDNGLADDRDRVVAQYAAVAKEWLGEPKRWLGGGARRADGAMLVIRDAGPMNNPNVPGKPTCPGPDAAGCRWRHPMAIEHCPASPCPIRGENASPIVVTDPERLAALATRFVVDEDQFRGAMRIVIEDVVTTAAREWNCRLTGRIE